MQDFYQSEQQKRIFNQLNSQQMTSGNSFNAAVMTHLSSPSTRRQQASQNHESSFLPKIDKNHNLSMMNQTEIPTLMPSRQTSSQDENARGSSSIRQKDNKSGRNQDYHLANKNQIASYEHNISFHNADYLTSTSDFQNNRHRRDKMDKMKTTNITTTSKLMGSQMSNQQHFYAQNANQQQQFNSLNQPQQQAHGAKAGKNHIKAHSQNFENSLSHGPIANQPHPQQKQPHHHRDRRNDSQLREKQDKQLEDLNETLQRLAREKYTKNVPGGAGGMQGRKKQRNNTNFTEKQQFSHDTQYMVAGIDPMLNHLHGFEKYTQAQAQAKAQEPVPNKKKEKKKQKKHAQGLDLMQQKFENQQRSALIMGDPLVNQRLQGVKQAQKTMQQSSNKNSVAGQPGTWQQKSPLKSPASPPQDQQHLAKQGLLMTQSPHGLSSAGQGAFQTQTPAQTTQKIFKIHMTLIDRSQGAQNSAGHDGKTMDSNAQDKHFEDSFAKEPVISSNSAQQVYTKGGIKISQEEPLILKTNHVKIQSAQSPVSFRQSQDPANPTVRTSNLIGPERILKQSIAIDSGTSSNMASQHYHTLNRFKSQSEQNQQINSLSESGDNNAPWTQSKVNLAANSVNKHQHQSIWNNSSLNQFQGNQNQNFEQWSQASIGGGNVRNNRLNASDHQQMVKLQINQKQFSSVLEDVEMEQQTSPLRRKAANELQVNELTHSQQSMLASYGGAGFQITKASVSDPYNKRNAQIDNSNRQSAQGHHQNGEMRNVASKQELISEIKYHYSQEKEMKAIAAATKGQPAQGPNDAMMTAPPKLNRMSPDGSGLVHGYQSKRELGLNSLQPVAVTASGHIIQPGEFTNQTSPKFAGEVNQHQNFMEMQGADSGAQSYFSNPDANSMAPTNVRGPGSLNIRQQWDGKDGRGMAMPRDNQAFQVVNRAARMNETMNMGYSGSVNPGLQATFGKVGLQTQQDFATDAIGGSPNRKKNLQLVDNNIRNSEQKLPMLIRQSPGVNLLPTSALRGANELHLLRASLRDNKSIDGRSREDNRQVMAHHRTTIDYESHDQAMVASQRGDQLAQYQYEQQSDALSKQMNRGKKKGLIIDDEVQQHNIQGQNFDYIDSADNASRTNGADQRIQIHMSQVFSVQSQQDQGNGTPKSLLNDNVVQIIHPGSKPPTTVDNKYLTYTYSGSPRLDREAQEHLKQQKMVAGNQENYMTISQSKQSLRNNSQISRHKKQDGTDTRKVVQRTNTQRVTGDAAGQNNNQQYNEQVIQSQLNDLTGQVSVSKMQTDTQLYLELPGQGQSVRQSGVKKSKTKGEQVGQSPRKQGDQQIQLKNQRQSDGTKQKNQGGGKQSAEAEGGKSNSQAPGPGANQQYRKTQNNYSPSKKERQGVSRQEPKQGQKPQQPFPTPRPQTPPALDEGDLSSEAPDSVHQLTVGFKVARETYSYCHEYVQFKGQNKLPRDCRHLFTGRSYQKGESQFAWSTRLYLSRECAFSEDRRRYPILIVNLDGAVGAWDDSSKNHYILRPKVVEGLIQLSYDFRLIAVSSNRQKLIYKVVQALMNSPSGPSSTGSHNVDAANNSSLLHLVFDAVYQLNSQNADVKYTNSIKNIDEIHFDLTQALTDMQFQKHKKKKPAGNRDKERTEEAKDKFQTFWETEEYRPCKKVLILTTDRWLFKSRCYSFDYNFLFQARKFMHEESKKAPIVLQLPHLRLNPKVSFDIVLQTIFTLQSIAQAQSCQRQDAQKCVEGEIYSNPDLSGFEICKKFLSSKLRHQQHKMKKEGNVKGLRVFDQQKDIFVDLELIDFGQAYSFLKKYLQERNSDWLTIKKYYLLYKPERVEITPLKLKQNLKVTFEESPDIRRIGDDQRDKAGSSLNGRAGATTHDSSKSDKFSFVKNQYVSEEAKNLYNALMIRNYKIQQEINSFARHYRIQQQRKLEKKKEQDRLAALQEEHQTPIVIYDSDKDNECRVAEPKLRSSLKEYPTHKMNLEKEKLEQEMKESECKEQSEQQIKEKEKKEKKYAFKYRVLQIRTNEAIDEGDITLKHYAVINLRIHPVTQYALRVPGGQVNDGGMAGVKDSSQGIATPRYVQNQDYLQHTANQVLDGYQCNNFLIDLLSKRQTKISYSTNQEMHLKNNLNQLVDGEQQYKDQHQKLQQDEKEQMAASQNQQAGGDNHKQTNNDKQENYLDKL